MDISDDQGRPTGNSLRLLPLDSTCCERHSTRTVRQWSYTLSWGKQTLSGIVADLHVFIHAIHCWSIDWICASPNCAKIIHLSTVLSFERRDSGAGLLTNQLQKQEVRTLIFRFSGCDVTSKWELSPLKGGIRQNCNEKDDKLMHHEILGFRKLWQPSYQKKSRSSAQRVHASTATGWFLSSFYIRSSSYWSLTSISSSWTLRTCAKMASAPQSNYESCSTVKFESMFWQCLLR